MNLGCSAILSGLKIIKDRSRNSSLGKTIWVPCEGGFHKKAGGAKVVSRMVLDSRGIIPNDCEYHFEVYVKYLTFLRC